MSNTPETQMQLLIGQIEAVHFTVTDCSGTPCFQLQAPFAIFVGWPLDVLLDTVSSEYIRFQF